VQFRSGEQHKSPRVARRHQLSHSRSVDTACIFSRHVTLKAICLPTARTATAQDASRSGLVAYCALDRNPKTSFGEALHY
jgi:hypothetical protein